MSSRLAASNAAFGLMQNNQARMDMISTLGSNSNLGDVFRSEQALTFSGLQNSLSYKVNMCQQEAWKKVLDNNIKKSFSYFA